MAAQDYEQLSYGGPAGAQLGASSTEKVGFFGAAPIARPAVTQQSTSTTTALRADLNRVEAALVLLGLISVT